MADPMMDFVRQHLLLLLSIAGLVLSFLASVTEASARRPSARFTAVALTLALVVAVVYQISAFNRQTAERQIEQAAQRARDGIIEQINLTVRETSVTVSAIAAQLSATPLGQVATALVTVRTSHAAGFEETLAFAKGSPAMWRHYADWLESLDGSGQAPSLSLTLNANHHYDPGLLLAYLLTGPATRSRLESVIGHPDRWHDFDAESLFASNLGAPAGPVQWVLFYDGALNRLAGFAEATAFTSELMVFLRLGEHSAIEQLLNRSGDDVMAALAQRFPAVGSAVFDTSRPSVLVEKMIARQIPLAVSAAGPLPHIVRLERMIQSATGER